MDSAKADGKKGGLIIPPPNIPEKVLESNKNTVPAKETSPPVEEKKEEKKVEVRKEGAKGTITIYTYENRPYEVKFTGEITGVEINIAWRTMYKEYKLWKRSLLKQGGK